MSMLGTACSGYFCYNCSKCTCFGTSRKCPKRSTFLWISYLLPPVLSGLAEPGRPWALNLVLSEGAHQLKNLDSVECNCRNMLKRAFLVL